MRSKLILLKSLNIIMLLWVAALCTYIGLNIWPDQAGISLILFCFSVGFLVRIRMLLKQKETKRRYTTPRQIWIEIILFIFMTAMLIKLLLMDIHISGKLQMCLFVALFFSLVIRILEWCWLRDYQKKPLS